MLDTKYDPYQNDILVTPSPSFTFEQVNEIANKRYGLTGTISPLESERDQNFRLHTVTGDQFVIKIANSAEDPTIIDMQVKALEHITLVDPTLPVPEVVLSRKGVAIEQIQAESGIKHSVRILSYLQGAYPKDDPTDFALHRPMGKCLGQLARALHGFFHPTANHELLWDLKHSSKLRLYLSYIENANHLELVSYFLDRFDQNVLPVIPKLRARIVHNDLTPDNILVAENDPGRIVGVIDFGDMTHTLLVIDLATTIASMLRGHADPVEAAMEIIAGYHEMIPLEIEELSVLYDLIAARLTMLNVIALWRVTIHPNNREYITGGVEETWQTLEAWRGLDPEVVTKKFSHICGVWEKEEERSTPQMAK